MRMDWFQRLTGFAEQDRAQVESFLRVEGGQLHSRCNGGHWSVGILELPSLAELRDRVAALKTQPRATQASWIRGDVRALHSSHEHAGAVFQVASQFNLLEMVVPDVTPDHGVTRYAFDHTQGPACAIAAGAATIYRNYFVPLDGGIGQQGARQINTLAALGSVLGHKDHPLWDYRNGYALCTADGLRRLNRHLNQLDAAQRDHLRGLLQIGVQWDVEVTDSTTTPGPRVTQVFCSAMPVAYSEHPAQAWEPFATLVLEAAYEATLLVATLNRARSGGSDQVLLTRLGGGAFGNDGRWIDGAIERALKLVTDRGLNVMHVAR